MCVTWNCSVRGKTPCRALVEQNGDAFTLINMHIHEPKPDEKLVATVSKKIKETAMKFVDKAAMPIVEEELTHIKSKLTAKMPLVHSLERQANRFRQAGRPTEPRSYDFEINMAHIPEGFMKKDVIALSGVRHLIFATNNQLGLLRNARTWYMDGTFELVRKPFSQLFTINVFVRKEDSMKQVPTVMVLMSRKSSTDYKEVLQAILSMLGSNIALSKIVVDFEGALWSTLNEMYPLSEKLDVASISAKRSCARCKRLDYRLRTVLILI